MRKSLFALALLFGAAVSLSAQVFNRIPRDWKWISPDEVAFTYDGSYTDAGAFSVTMPGHHVTEGIKAPEKYSSFPMKPQGAKNLTYSPDSTMLAFTRDNNLFVVDIASGRESQLTSDGTDLILNGYASWVYYEEILGRPSMYKAFWWSPDSRKIGFYRFDNTNVPMFPIYSPDGQDGRLNLTRYPKAGEPNPEVRIGIVDVKDASKPVVWADFDEHEDQYFGIPFWSADSRSFYVAREPRIQNTLDLYAVSAEDGSRKQVYHEKVNTWLEWIDGMIFTEKGLYMARDFETGWQQIYFLSYDGKTLRRLTDGPNWRVNIVRVDEKKGDVYYTAHRDATTKPALYRADAKGNITALTDTSYAVSGVKFSPDGRYFVAAVSNFSTPTQLWVYETANADKAWRTRSVIASAPRGKRPSNKFAGACYKVADLRGPEFDGAGLVLPEIVKFTTEDGFVLPGAITYPKNFDPSKKYPVHVEIYGGPDTPYVRDRWTAPSYRSRWFSEAGIISIVIDARSAGHNGRAGLDQVYCNLTDKPVSDFVEWGRWLQSLPYVQADKIGVEGFSFGGTMTAMLLCDHSDVFHYGIAGGGVYDWILYDTHYTERFMETPQTNPDGYEAARVISHVKSYPVNAYDRSNDGKVMLKITHGTGDDNVHFQNTLQLINEMQSRGKSFELMIYPDAMHGYRGVQGEHSMRMDMEFWSRYLLR